MAYDNFRRQIEVLEHNGIDDINLPTQYASLAQCALELDMPDSAFVALQKAASLPKRTTYQEFTVNKGFGLYYIRTENFAEAKKRLEASEELFRRDPSLRFHTAGLSYLRTAYFKASGQYGKALETILETQRDTVIRSSGFNNYALTKELGDVYWHLREMERAAANYREYIRLSDSVRNREIRTATDDFSGILEISRLHNETKELQYDLQRKRLRNTYLIICLLAGVLVTGGVGYARMMKLNRRLKASEATVLAQNEHLRISGEELLEAKEQAEQASRMKTEFIQHMSHEVRTPLNSIVGFSQVLASEFRDKPATGEYASIIEANSATLLRLFDDVLEVAYLDQTGDFKLEANIEYRFGIMGRLNGAVFLDAGNIWLLKKDPKRPGAELKWKGFLNDIALGTGFGLRYDISYLVIRADLGIGLHTPYPNPDKKGYYNISSFKDGLGFHLAIGYPF